MWSYIVAASQGDPPVGSSRVFGALPHPFRGPSRPPAVLFRQPAARPRPLGEPSRPPGEPSRRAGEPSRHLGESSRPSGESSRPLGEPSRPHGESSRSLGEPSRPHGESSRSLGEPSRPHGESSRPTARSSRPVVRISRPTVRSVRPRQDSPMPRSQPVFRYNGPYPRTLRHGLRSRQENHNSETRRSHSLPCIQARLTRPPIDIRKVTGLYPTLEGLLIRYILVYEEVELELAKCVLV
ncbi:unnamed protein product [Pieris brassicae]|uniref:Uncharacterized protein n=1 Tax=Pieris brassicae TaxID=7116 RepID=A0A9P0U0T7_PIEBR|nr:unnamed protein product [Pieris brassicae]